MKWTDKMREIAADLYLAKMQEVGEEEFYARFDEIREEVYTQVEEEHEEIQDLPDSVSDTI